MLTYFIFIFWIILLALIILSLKYLKCKKDNISLRNLYQEELTKRMALELILKETEVGDLIACDYSETESKAVK